MVGRYDEYSIVMWILEWEDGSAIFVKICFFDGVGDCGVEGIANEEAIACGVWGLEDISDCGMTVEDHYY